MKNKDNTLMTINDFLKEHLTKEEYDRFIKDCVEQEASWYNADFLHVPMEFYMNMTQGNKSPVSSLLEWSLHDWNYYSAINDRLMYIMREEYAS